MEKGNKVFILTGPVHTGKSTALKAWLNSKGTKMGGFLHIGKPKQLLLLGINALYTLEKETQTESTDICVGKYVFADEAFKIMNTELASLSSNQKNIIIIDEIGKLELKGQGIDKGLELFCRSLSSFNNSIVIFVVRDFLIEEVVKKYHLQDAIIIQKEELNSI